MHGFNILRVFGIVGFVPLYDFLIRCFIYLVRRSTNGSHATWHETLSQTLRKLRKICEYAKSAKGLAEKSPLPQLIGIPLSKCLTDGLTVLDYAIRSEELQILRLFECITLQCECCSRYGSTQTCSPLIKIEHLVAFFEYGIGDGHVLGSWARMTRTSLEVDEPWLLRALALLLVRWCCGRRFMTSDCSGENLKCTWRWIGVISGDFK